VSFTPSSGFQFTDAQLALESSGGTSADVYLESDASGSPGSILDTLVEQSPIIGGSGSLITFDCASCPTLTAGTTYWIVATAGAVASWDLNDTGENGGAYNYSGSPTGPWNGSGLPTPAFEVDGTPLTSSVPEPGPLVLLGTAGAGLALALRRKARPAAGRR